MATACAHYNQKQHWYHGGYIYVYCGLQGHDTLQSGTGYGSSKDIPSPCHTPKQFIGKEKLNENKMTPARLTENFEKQTLLCHMTKLCSCIS
jgi:hypothetical protein